MSELTEILAALKRIEERLKVIDDRAADQVIVYEEITQSISAHGADIKNLTRRVTELEEELL